MQMMNNIWDEFARCIRQCRSRSSSRGSRPLRQNGGPRWGFSANSSQTRRLTEVGGLIAGRDDRRVFGCCAGERLEA